LTSLRARFKIIINILNKNNNENQMGAANLCFSQFTPLGREEVADAITGAWQRCAAEEEDDEDNIRSDGRDPNGLYRQKRQAGTYHIKDKRIIIIIRMS
jgi:hypothetical protein